MASVLNFGAVRVHLGEKSGKYPDGNQLIAWLRSMGHAPDQVYVVHGEMGAADHLRQRIAHELRWSAQVPEHGSSVSL